MPSLPRLAVGTFQPAADPRPVNWAIMELFTRRGLQVQSFLSRACFHSYKLGQAITGVVPRHLDSWLMSEPVCCEVFAHSSKSCDLALVEGEFGEHAPQAARSSLEQICQWLDLPRLVIVDARQLAACQEMPARPEADALILDGVRDDRHRFELCTAIEPLWDMPVLGSLETLPTVRAAIDALEPWGMPDRELSLALAESLDRTLNYELLWKLADGRPMARIAPQLFKRSEDLAGLRVAVAYDEAFHCYFRETLDRLELAGASVVDFSPLRDESLPTDVDTVMFGCGHIADCLPQLSANHCMAAALRDHVRAGKRLYAQGDGLAYLCREVVRDGQTWPMVGIFSAVAREADAQALPIPSTVRIDRESWLSPAGATLRGYRSLNWQIERASKDLICLAGREDGCDLLQSGSAIGSRLHFHFAAAPALFARLFPARPVVASS